MLGFGKKSKNKHGAFPSPEEEDELFDQLLRASDTGLEASSGAEEKPAETDTKAINKAEVDRIIIELNAKEDSAKTAEEVELVSLEGNLHYTLKHGRRSSNILTNEEKETLSDEDYIKKLFSAKKTGRTEIEDYAVIYYEDLYRRGFEYRKTHKLLTEAEKTKNREFRKRVGLPHDPDFDPE